MVPTILTVLLIGTYNLVLTQPLESTVDSTVSNATDTTVTLTEDVTEKAQLLFDKLNLTTKQEIREIIEKLDKKYQERKGFSLFNVSRPVESAPEVSQVDVGSRGGFPIPVLPPDEQYLSYTQPLSYDPAEPAPLFAYTFPPRSDIRRGSFSIFDRLTADMPEGLSVHQVLEGPINVAIPMRNHEILVYFVNRGLKSVKFSPSLRPLNEALTRQIRKVGLTLPAAFSVRSRYLSWPVKSVVFADPVFLADIANAATYPTVLFVPEDDIELTRMAPDVFRIADFSLLDGGIRYVLPQPLPPQNPIL